MFSVCFCCIVFDSQTSRKCKQVAQLEEMMVQCFKKLVKDNLRLLHYLKKRFNEHPLVKTLRIP